MSELRSIIRLEGLKKVFYTDEVETHALSDIHLEIGEGEYLAVAGPSGCGKSTLLSIMGLLDAPTEGGYELDGQAVARLTRDERARVRNRRIGFIFQAFNLIGDLTVRENVELPLTYRRFPVKERRDYVETSLEKVGMAHRRNHYPSQLSGGQQQRVAIARALAGEPRFLLADEPTGNLDESIGAGILSLLARLNDAGQTIIMVTHDPKVGSDAHRSLVLKEGVIHESSGLSSELPAPAPVGTEVVR